MEVVWQCDAILMHKAVADGSRAHDGGRVQVGKKQVVPGLEKGIIGMKAGEQRQVFVKSQWGYGEDGVCLDTEEEEDASCLVPPDTDLVYDVTLVNVCPAPNM